MSSRCEGCISRHCNECNNFSNFLSEKGIKTPYATAEFRMPYVEFTPEPMATRVDLTGFAPAIDLEREITERMAERMARDIEVTMMKKYWMGVDPIREED